MDFHGHKFNVYSSGILTELENVQAFLSNDDIAKYASIAWI